MSKRYHCFVQQYEATSSCCRSRRATRLMQDLHRPTKIVGTDAFSTGSERGRQEADNPPRGNRDHRHPHSRRKITMADYDDADLIDDPDVVKMLIDPDLAVCHGQAYAFNRAIDDAILDALGGPAYSGVAGQPRSTL